jgi:uncharacterized membrane protein YvbJ
MRTERDNFEYKFFNKELWEKEQNKIDRRTWILWSITMAVFIFCLLFFSFRYLNKIEQEEAEKIRQIELKYYPNGH